MTICPKEPSQNNQTTKERDLQSVTKYVMYINTHTHTHTMLITRTFTDGDHLDARTLEYKFLINGYKITLIT